MPNPAELFMKEITKGEQPWLSLKFIPGQLPLALLAAAIASPAVAGTLCVDSAGSHGCYATIQAAVNHASANDVINVEPGRYAEEVTIGIPLALIGAGAEKSVIEGVGLAHGVFVDGFDHAGLTPSPLPDSRCRMRTTKASWS